MTQQTAVEFVIDKILNGDWESTPWPKRREIIEQAKQMEKEQVILAINEMKRDVIGNTMFNKEMKFQNGEEYYNETYNK